jgi:hypothetical protein
MILEFTFYPGCNHIHIETSFTESMREIQHHALDSAEGKGRHEDSDPGLFVSGFRGSNSQPCAEGF